MKETRIIMGMPIEIEIVGGEVKETLEAAFAYLSAVDEQFSMYKETSEISRINRGELSLAASSKEMLEVLAIAERTKEETYGYFDIQKPDGSIDPSGIVKGWAIKNTAALIRNWKQDLAVSPPSEPSHENYMVNAGGDIAMSGKNAEGNEWNVGIRNPFNIQEIIKVVYPKGKGIATSGSYIRGDHIYNPHAPEEKLKEIVSITVIGSDVLDADRFATAAFAMGKKGIEFIEQLPDYDGYAIDAAGIATLTSGWERYTY